MDRLTAIVLALSMSGCSCGGSSSQPDATTDITCGPGTSLSLREIAGGLSRPLYIGAPKDDPRLFVIEQPGRIRIIENDNLVSTPFLDIESLIRDTGNEQGLLGMAFHPDYASNRTFYVNYTNTNGDTVVAKYTASEADPNVANTDETILFTLTQPYSNHNGGNMAFGPDGFLYIGTGDGGNGGDPDGNGQNNTTLLASMLRIDVDNGTPYAIPSTNPFASSPDGPSDPRPEIWAIGFRNPWRFSFDRTTGDLYIGDVGQNTYEEVDVQAASSTGGENYGWRIMEANSCFNPATGCDMNGLSLPVASYDHSANKCSVTGGYVYRGNCMPDVQGWYFYGDYCTNQIWKIEYPGDTTPVELSSQLSGVNGISSFGEGADGELYVASLNNGRIYKIVPGQ